MLNIELVKKDLTQKQMAILISIASGNLHQDNQKCMQDTSLITPEPSLRVLCKFDLAERGADRHERTGETSLQTVHKYYQNYSPKTRHVYYLTKTGEEVAKALYVEENKLDVSFDELKQQFEEQRAAECERQRQEQENLAIELESIAEKFKGVPSSHGYPPPRGDVCEEIKGNAKFIRDHHLGHFSRNARYQYVTISLEGLRELAKRL